MIYYEDMKHFACMKLQFCNSVDYICREPCKNKMVCQFYEKKLEPSGGGLDFSVNIYRCCEMWPVYGAQNLGVIIRVVTASDRSVEDTLEPMLQCWESS